VSWNLTHDQDEFSVRRFPYTELENSGMASRGLRKMTLSRALLRESRN